MALAASIFPNTYMPPSAREAEGPSITVRYWDLAEYVHYTIFGGQLFELLLLSVDPFHFCPTAHRQHPYPTAEPTRLEYSLGFCLNLCIHSISLVGVYGCASVCFTIWGVAQTSWLAFDPG